MRPYPHQKDSDHAAILRSAHGAITTVEESLQIDPVRLRNQVRRAGLTAIFGLIAGLGVLGYILWGPTLSPQRSVLVVFLLFASLTLVVFGTLTAVLPLLTSLAHAKLDRIRNDNRLFQAEDSLVQAEGKLEETVRDLDTVLSIVDEVCAATDKGTKTRAILEHRQEEISEIRSRHLAGSGC